MALKLDNSLLEELGLGALPEGEKQLLLRQIYEKLEMNVGMRLADQMSNEQLDAFEKFVDANDDKGAFQWLETNFPNYKDVVNEEFEKLKVEIRSVAPQILASAQQNAAAVAAGTVPGQPHMPGGQSQFGQYGGPGPSPGAPAQYGQPMPPPAQPYPPAGPTAGQPMYGQPPQGQPIQSMYGQPSAPGAPAQYGYGPGSQPAAGQPYSPAASPAPSYGQPQPAAMPQGGHVQPQYGVPQSPPQSPPAQPAPGGSVQPQYQPFGSPSSPPPAAGAGDSSQPQSQASSDDRQAQGPDTSGQRPPATPPPAPQA